MKLLLRFYESGPSMTSDDHTAKRQLVVLCDGTNNNFTAGTADTNVARLCVALQSQPSQGQLVFYDPGVGNSGTLPPVTWIDWVSHHINRLSGLAFGRGVYDNIAEAYGWLVRHWQPGDEIYVFGFSRGAFTARAVAGLVNQYGIASDDMRQMIPTLVHHYFLDKERINLEQLGQYDALTEQLRAACVPAHARDVPVQFTGAWDTVESVGLFGGARFRRVAKVEGTMFRNVRHAVALDEQRSKFNVRLFAQDNGSYQGRDGAAATLEQLWFRGCHCDVGGGNPLPDQVLARAPLLWICCEAGKCGLRLGEEQHADEAPWRKALGLPAQDDTSEIKRVQSEPHGTPPWAMVGLHARNTQPAIVANGSQGGERRPLESAEHPSVAAWPARFPEDTVWAHSPGQHIRLVTWLALAVVLLFVWLHAALLAPTHTKAQTDAGIPAGSQCWLDDALPTLRPNCVLARWQLGAFRLVGADHVRASVHARERPEPSLWDGSAFGWPRWALVFDTLFVAALSWLLCLGAGRHYAQSVGLRRYGARSPSALGYWATIAIAGYAASDLAENALTALVWSSVQWLPPSPWWLAAGFLSLAAWLKFACLSVAIVYALPGWARMIARR
jgi:uncharacterized protein (DUF2235 family)